MEEGHVLEGLVLAKPKVLGLLAGQPNGILVESIKVLESTSEEYVASFSLRLDEGVLAKRLAIVWDFEAVEVREIGYVMSKIMNTSSRKRKRKSAHSPLIRIWRATAAAIAILGRSTRQHASLLLSYGRDVFVECFFDTVSKG